ncbi:M55 family metallopeptidase [Natrononativus amylolyticus]|uniref:M55 family metallopeptidase n=1 Tax=Natrononativus amylolyticus TaxID=2963434 RepID=UPI0020CDAC2B|nr:M55 family metallopeptidase [Natrononativus amylolyticus]
MRVFISADMEGVSGIAAPEDVSKGEPEYGRGTELMAADVNAAIDGALESGADEILVNDSHSTMRNLEAGALREEARLIRGGSKPRSMMQGLTADHDVAFFVGYHAMAGTPGAVLNHTYYAHELVSLHVDGREVGELGYNAALARALGVPVGLVTGDDKTALEAEAELEDVETAVVKEGVYRFAADCLPLEAARREIREAAATAVERARSGDFDQPDRPQSATVEAAWATTNLARAAARADGVERSDGRTTRVERESYLDAFDAATAMLGSAAGNRSEHFG